MHSYSEDSFWLLAITCDGKMLLHDMKMLINKEDQDWNFTNSKYDNERDIAYNADYVLDFESGLTNMWAGYGREKTVLDLDTGVSSLVTQDIKPMLATTQNLGINSSITHRIDTFGVANENIHSRYWSAYWQNLRNLFVFSSLGFNVTVTNYNKPIKVLDTVFLSEPQVNGTESQDFNAGIYIVSKVATNINLRSISLSVTLCRESLNKTTGDLV
jgi:hypothetical protein